MRNLKKENENAVGLIYFCFIYESNNAAITLKVFLLIHFNLNYGAVLFPHPLKQTRFRTDSYRSSKQDPVTVSPHTKEKKNTTYSVCKQTRFSMFKHT